MAVRTGVLVIGGGPSGATAARRLSEAGIDVVLLEKDLHRRKPCGGAIPSSAFDELDIPLKMPHRRVERIRFVSPSDRRLDIELKGGCIIVVDRGGFDSMLRHLAMVAGTQVLEGEFVDLRARNGRLVSTVRIGGRPRVIESDYLISSDGVNSRVRRALGLGAVSSAYTISCEIEGLRSDVCEFWFSTEHASRFYSWVFPRVDPLGEGALSTVGTGVKEGGKGRLYLERFLRRLKIVIDDEITPRGFRIPLWEDGPYRAGNVLFVGDAASQVMPFTYEGIYYAMKSGEFAAEAVINGRPSLYRKLWRGRFYSRFRLMRTLERVFLQSNGMVERLLDIFSRPEVQEASMQLWLKKDPDRGSLLSYINLFRKFLR